MNDLTKTETAIPAPDLDDAWSTLMKLARMVRIDDATGTLTIVNGRSRIVLRADGEVRVEGRTLVQTAEGGIALSAAFIDLN